MNSLKILFINDQTYGLEILIQGFLDRGCTIDRVSDVQQALRFIQQSVEGYDIVVIGSGLSNRQNGAELLTHLQQFHPSLPIIVVLTQESEKGQVQVLSTGVIETLSTTPNWEEVDALLRYGHHLRTMRQELGVARRERDQFQSLLSKIASMMTYIGPDTLVELYGILMDTARSLTAADDTALSIYEPWNDQFKIHARSVSDVPLIWQNHFKKNVPKLSEHILRQQALEYISDTTKHELINPQVYKSNIRAILGVPIGEMGVLYAYSFTPGHFSPGDIDIIRMLASQAAIAMLNNERFRVERALQEASVVLNSKELDDIPDLILKLIREIVPYDTASVQLLDGDYLRIECGEGFGARFDQEVRGSRFWLSDNSAPNGQVVRSQRPLILQNAPTQYDSFKSPPHDRIKGWIGVPMVVSQDVIGIITLDRHTPGFYNENHAQLAQTFATHAAIALLKAGWHEQRRRSLSHIFEAAKLMGEETLGPRSDSKKRLELALRRLVEAIQEVLHCDSVVLYRYDKARKEVIELPVEVGLDGVFTNLDAVNQYFLSSPPDRILKMETNAYFADDVPLDEVMKGTFAIENSIASAAGFRLDVGDSIKGLLFINYTHSHKFSENDKFLTHVLVALTTVAVRNLQSYQREQQHMEHLDTIHRATQAIIQSTKRDDILNTLLEGALEITSAVGEPALYVNIQLYDAEHEMMEFTHAKPDGIIDQLKQKFSHRISLKTGYENKIGITGLAIQTRRPQYAKNIHLGQWPNYYIEYHPETMCEFAIPLIAGEHVIGVLNVEHAVEGGLDEQDCQALDALAQQAVVAIQKTEQQELVIKRTTLASRYLGRELDRHTLNLKIGTIRNYVGALQNSLKKPLSRKGEMRARNALQRIEEAASELENLRERPLVTEVIDININELITKHQRALWTKENYRAVKCQLDLQLPDNLTVQANPHWLCEVIEILVDNAVKAMKASKVKHLTITTREVEREKGKWGDIILTDTGCGMSDETRSAFGKRPIEKSDIEGGMGIGVLMADYIIDTYQGKLWVEDTNPGGTTIIVRLPLDA